MHLNLKYKPSTFFSNFSISELVKKNNSRSGIICSFGGGGAVGFGTGGSQANDSEESRFTSHDSYSCHIKSERLNEFDGTEVVRSLREDIEHEITRTGAKIINSTDLDLLGFYIEYSDEDIQGNIKITGSLSEENFKLEATRNELSKSERTPFVERREDVYQPVGNYYVVAFDREDANARTFYEKGRKAAEDSRERLRQKYLADPAKGKSISESMEQAIMYVWAPMPPRMRQTFQEMMGEDFADFTEYDQWGRVYFLNELALRMYRDIGEDFEVLKILTAEEVSKIPGGPSFRVYYTKLHK